MNIIKGRVTEVGGKPIFRSRDFSIELKNMPSALQGSRVEIGIRPEDVAITNDFDGASCISQRQKG